MTKLNKVIKGKEQRTQPTVVEIIGVFAVSGRVISIQGRPV